VILKNLSEQDICFDSNLKELIDLEGNVMDLFDQHDSKGQMLSTCSQEELPIDHAISLARNIPNQLLECPALVVKCNEICMFVLIHLQ
jgi:hypothetical protein